MSDPRVFFAAERTLLAWVRSGLTVMALGFVVARFGLFLSVLSAAAPATPHPTYWLSNALGVALVALGTVVTLGALYNHRGFVQSLPPDDVPHLSLPWLTTLLSIAIAMIGVLLAAYLTLA